MAATVSGRAADTDLAAELFQERNWSACAREADRTLARSPGLEEAVFLRTVSLGRMGKQQAADLAALRTLAANAADRELRCRAAYECARHEWRKGNRPPAFALFRQAFLETTDTDLSLHAACSMFLLLEEDSSLEPRTSNLRIQINTTRWIWYGRLFDDCRVGRDHTAKGGLLAAPARFVTWVYRNAVAPALGQRCALTPSCSQYYMEASEQHGLLGFPIVADRFCREPGVPHDGRQPIRVSGLLRYPDPLADHDGWLTGRHAQDIRRMFHKDGMNPER